MNTQTKLTAAEIARIFMMYPGAEMILEKSGRIEKLAGTLLEGNVLELIYSIEKNGITYLKEPVYYEYFPFKLLLTPVEKITDDHAIEVARVAFGNFHATIENGRNYVHHCIFKCGLPEEKVRELLLPAWKHYKIYQYLLLHRYALPIWFDDMDSPLNNKTPIELGIAIDKTTIE
jgi:hypothetical protein